MKFDLFGRTIEVVLRSDSGWNVFDPGADGKKRAANDILIPASAPEDELQTYLDGLFHEYTTAEHSAAHRLDQALQERLHS